MILGVLALVFVVLYFGGWGLQSIVKYMVAAIMFVVMAAGYMIKGFLKLIHIS